MKEKEDNKGNLTNRKISNWQNNIKNSNKWLSFEKQKQKNYSKNVEIYNKIMKRRKKN